MISAANRRPRLNGSSRLLTVFLLLLLSLFACGTAKQTTTTYPAGPRPEKYPPHKKKEEKNENPPVVSGPTHPKQTKDTVPPPATVDDTFVPEARLAMRPVRVAILLPFLSDRFDPSAESVPPKSHIALQFYTGFRMALDEAGDDLAIDLHVLDTKADRSTTEQLLQRPVVRDAHIIIGPYRKSNAVLVAQQAVRSGQIMCAPFASIPRAPAGKGVILETAPGLDTYMERILAFASKDPSRKIYIVKRNNGADDRPVAALRRAKEALSIFQPVVELAVESSDLSFEDLHLKDSLSITPGAFFIVPAWKDPNYISSIVRKIYVSRDPESDELPTVIGLPQWLSFKNLDFQKLIGLNTFIPSADVVVHTPQTRQFAAAYFEQYGALPAKYAYRGYDLGRYLVRFIRANSTGTWKIPDDSALFMEYHFDGTDAEGVPIRPGQNHFRNISVKMYRLEDFQLKEVKDF